MGNAQGTLAGNVNKSNNINKSDQTQLNGIMDRINKLSQALYKMYGVQFGNNKFCQQVALTYEKKLGQLPVYQLQNISDKIDKENGMNQVGMKKLDAFLTYNPKPDEKFLVNELKTNLVDFFCVTVFCRGCIARRIMFCSLTTRTSKRRLQRK